MRRAIAAVPAVLLALACAPAGATQQPLLPAPAIPPELQALEAKADALQITSERLSLSTSFDLAHVPKAARRFLRLLELKLEGVETVSPPAAALNATLLGAHVKLRFVEGHGYLFSWKLGRRDGGRPWVKLGTGSLGEEFGGLGKKPSETVVSGAQRYGKLFTLLNDGTGLHPLAPATLYGQPVTGWGAEVESKQTQSEEPAGTLFGSAAAKRPVLSAKLSVYFAPSGAIVRAQVQTGGTSRGATVTSDVPAINFPYSITAPAASHVIGERVALRRFPSVFHALVAPATQQSSSSTITVGKSKQ